MAPGALKPETSLLRQLSKSVCLWLLISFLAGPCIAAETDNVTRGALSDEVEAQAKAEEIVAVEPGLPEAQARIKDQGIAGQVVAEKVSESPAVEILDQSSAMEDNFAGGQQKNGLGFYSQEPLGMDFVEHPAYMNAQQQQQQQPHYNHHHHQLLQQQQQQQFAFVPQPSPGYPAYEEYFQRSNGNYASHPSYSIANKPNHLSSTESSSLNILYQEGAQSERRRPTLHNLSPSEAVTVNTPQELLDYCCRFPACYDPLFDLCIDTCRKCETEYPVTSWLPCPPLLNIPDCTSDSLSKLGRLPLACFPDIGPFANIMPVSSVMTVPMAFQSASSGVRGRGKDGSLVNNPLYPFMAEEEKSTKREQDYRREIQMKNRKSCNREGLCLSERRSAPSQINN